MTKRVVKNKSVVRRQTVKTLPAGYADLLADLKQRIRASGAVGQPGTYPVVLGYRQVYRRAPEGRRMGQIRRGTTRRRSPARVSRHGRLLLG